MGAGRLREMLPRAEPSRGNARRLKEDPAGWEPVVKTRGRSIVSEGSRAGGQVLTGIRDRSGV
jgi:hypothetical protein